MAKRLLGTGRIIRPVAEMTTGLRVKQGMKVWGRQAHSRLGIKKGVENVINDVALIVPNAYNNAPNISADVAQLVVQRTCNA